MSQLILSLVILSGCGVYESVYQDQPLVIDGSSSDWTTTLDSKNNNGMSYGISNDTENLFIRLNINDQDIQRKIFLAGLTIWIDTTGKKKETFGITCPIKKTPSKMDRNAVREMQKAPKWNKNQLLETEFIGFKDYSEIFYASQNPYKIEISIDQDEFKSLYYELKIPFSAIQINYADLLLKTLSVGFETGALKMPSSGSGPAGMSSRPPGMSGGGRGGSGGRGGGGKGGGPSGGMQSNSSMNTPTKIWIKNIKLAQQ